MSDEVSIGQLDQTSLTLVSLDHPREFSIQLEETSWSRERNKFFFQDDAGRLVWKQGGYLFAYPIVESTEGNVAVPGIMPARAILLKVTFTNTYKKKTSFKGVLFRRGFRPFGLCCHVVDGQAVTFPRNEFVIDNLWNRFKIAATNGAITDFMNMEKQPPFISLDDFRICLIEGTWDQEPRKLEIIPTEVPRAIREQNDIAFQEYAEFIAHRQNAKAQWVEANRRHKRLIENIRREDDDIAGATTDNFWFRRLATTVAVVSGAGALAVGNGFLRGSVDSSVGLLFFRLFLFSGILAASIPALMMWKRHLPTTHRQIADFKETVDEPDLETSKRYLSDVRFWETKQKFPLGALFISTVVLLTSLIFLSPRILKKAVIEIAPPADPVVQSAPPTLQPRPAPPPAQLSPTPLGGLAQPPETMPDQTPMPEDDSSSSSSSARDVDAPPSPPEN